MTSPLVRCARWGALGTGIVYGFVHRRSLTRQVAEEKVAAEYARKERLIADAKAEYARLYRPVSTGGVITDPENPAFDLEALLKHAETTQA
ncbi:ATP synthase E chain-domain-containing protein [Thamnocephalis sphaerospora]|uniref:ATP synthase F(0) complex subunit e, mitochondrial n=1 Tax=Thamnocephalis sphaerospora TaxID=78915 RepID=A0A4P9XX54_9FUNG|nr:ATP synthase E chain-domain-containing protein [Thamnocephalis sphaerospora]|eukprot:RKP10936.1 ATP synthase E chain-domain-containing protein [Thamnocephalis sphaerospora]